MRAIQMEQIDFIRMNGHFEIGHRFDCSFNDRVSQHARVYVIGAYCLFLIEMYM